MWTARGQAKFGGFSEQQQQIFFARVRILLGRHGSGTRKDVRLRSPSAGSRRRWRHGLFLSRTCSTTEFLGHAVRTARSLRGRTPTLGKDARGVTHQCRRGKLFQGSASWRSRRVGCRKYRSCPLRSAQYCTDEIDARPSEGGWTTSTCRPVDRSHLYRPLQHRSCPASFLLSRERDRLTASKTPMGGCSRPVGEMSSASHSPGRPV